MRHFDRPVASNLNRSNGSSLSRMDEDMSSEKIKIASDNQVFGSDHKPIGDAVKQQTSQIAAEIHYANNSDHAYGVNSELMSRA